MRTSMKNSLFKMLQDRTGVRAENFITHKGDFICIVSDETMSRLLDIWADEHTTALVPPWHYMAQSFIVTNDESGAKVEVPEFTVADNEGGEFYVECFHSKRVALNYFDDEKYYDVDTLYEADRKWLLKRGLGGLVRQ